MSRRTFDNNVDQAMKTTLKTAAKTTLTTLRAFALLLVLQAGVAAHSPDFVLHISSATANLGEEKTVAVTLDNLEHGVLALSYGVRHDPTVVGLVALDSGAALQSVNDDAGVEFEVLEQDDGGFVHSFVVSLSASPALPVGHANEMVRATYQLSVDGTSELTFADDIGEPPTEVILVDEHYQTLRPVLSDGKITTARSTTVKFFRGDSNSDGATDISDASFSLNFLFLGGPAPPAPGVESCGPDPTDDMLAPCVSDGGGMEECL